MHNAMIFFGSSADHLKKEICEYIGIKPAESIVKKFSNGETCIEILESVRNKQVFIVQTGCDRVNDMIMEMLLMINACKLGSASKIVTVIPSYPYARQDKKDKSRVPISAKLMADMLVCAGVNHVITMDLHAPQIQGFFDIPVDNLYSLPGVVGWVRENFINLDQCVIVAPDVGGVKRATSVAEKVGTNIAVIHKERKKANEVSRMTLIGDVRNKVAIIVDDMADTCGTICCAADRLLEAEALRVIAICTHGVLSGAALENITKSQIDSVVVSNTISQDKNSENCAKLQVINVSSIFGEAIRRCYYGESVSRLFKV